MLRTCAHLSTVTFTNSEIWTNAHITTAILCACLPIYKPIRAKSADLFRTLHNKYSSTLRHVFSTTRIRVSEDTADGHASDFPMQNMETNSHHTAFYHRSQPRSVESDSDLLPTLHDANHPSEASPYEKALALEAVKYPGQFKAT